MKITSAPIAEAITKANEIKSRNEWLEQQIEGHKRQLAEHQQQLESSQKLLREWEAALAALTA